VASRLVSPFRPRFIGSDESLADDWEDFTNGLIKTMFEEANLR
jgi:hypothetical protein